MNRAQGKQIGIQTLVTWLPLIPILWFVGKPILVTSVSEALAGEIQDTVKKEVAPISTAFQILLQLDINGLRKAIAALEFSEGQGGEEWTADDAEVLIETELEMEALEGALEALQETV